METRTFILAARRMVNAVDCAHENTMERSSRLRKKNRKKKREGAWLRGVVFGSLAHPAARDNDVQTLSLVGVERRMVPGDELQLIVCWAKELV